MQVIHRGDEQDLQAALPLPSRALYYQALLELENVDIEDHFIHHYKFGLQTQLLRTCRAIKSEAEYVLRRNHFIKLTVHAMTGGISWFTDSRVPYIHVNSKQAEELKSHVLTHQISPPGSLSEAPRASIFRGCDLDRFCLALSEYQADTSQYKRLLTHVVTLRDPYEGSTTPHEESFLNEGLQRDLVAPYLARLRNLPYLILRGRFSKALKQGIEEEISSPFPSDVGGVLREVEALKAGRLFCRRDGPFFREDTEAAI